MARSKAKERFNNIDSSIQVLSLSVLDEHPMNEQIFNMDMIEELAAVIKTEGFNGAITVTPRDNGRYQILSGHRRVRALKILGWNKIPCIITDKKTDNEVLKDLINSNLQNRDLHPLDYIRAIREYTKILESEHFKGNKRQEICKFFNLAESTVRRFQCIGKLNEDLQAYTNDPDFPYTALDYCFDMNASDQELLVEMLSGYFDKNSTREISKTTIFQFCENIKTIRREEEFKKRLEQNRAEIMKGKNIKNPNLHTTELFERKDEKALTKTVSAPEAIWGLDEIIDDEDWDENIESLDSDESEDEDPAGVDIADDVIKAANILSAACYNKNAVLVPSRDVKRALKDLERIVQMLKEQLH